MLCFYFKLKTPNKLHLSQPRIPAIIEWKLKNLTKSSLTKLEKGNADRVILDNKEKAKSFATNIALMNYPNLLKPIKIKCAEDKTSKFWFLVVRVCPSEYCFDEELEMIVLKSNCKIIWYYQTS